MHISTRADYALQAMLAVAQSPGGLPVKAADLAASQHLPARYLHTILVDLRRGGLLLSQRGADGGYALTRPANQISVGDILRVMGGELSSIRGQPARLASYCGAAVGLRDFWVEVHTALARRLDHTMVSDLLPAPRTEPQPDGVL